MKNQFKMNKNKRASVIDLLIWLVISFVTILFFAVWIYGFNLVTEELVAINSTVFSTSIGSVAEDTFGKINPVQTRMLHVLAFVIIFMMGMTIMLGNFLVKSHPAFFLVYLMVIIGAIMASAILSNQYEVLLQSQVIGETLSEFSAANFIMLNFPIWTAVIGIFGAIFLFSGIIRDEGAGGSVV